MLLFEQLDFLFGQRATVQTASPTNSGRDATLELRARAMLRAIGVDQLAPKLRVEWNGRLRTAAGRADCRQNVISLNIRLREHGPAEIDRTLRHELAHLVAHFRAGRRRIAPHGAEWRQACHDLGIGDEKRCHTLPFPTRKRRPRFLYRCPKCARDFPRVRRIRGAVACLACCRQHNHGRFAAQFRLRLAQSN